MAVVCVLLLLALVAGCAAQKPPNILFILSDDLGGIFLDFVF
jgi:hypothetical protein